MDSFDQLDDFAEDINLCPSSPIAISFARNACCVSTFITPMGGA